MTEKLFGERRDESVVEWKNTGRGNGKRTSRLEKVVGKVKE